MGSWGRGRPSLLRLTAEEGPLIPRAGEGAELMSVEGAAAAAGGRRGAGAELLGAEVINYSRLGKLKQSHLSHISSQVMENYRFIPILHNPVSGIPVTPQGR